MQINLSFNSVLDIILISEDADSVTVSNTSLIDGLNGTLCMAFVFFNILTDSKESALSHAGLAFFKRVISAYTTAKTTK